MPDVILKDGATIEDTIAMLKKTLSWLMANLDHDNVKRLFTEYCQIKSAEGETEIAGPLILMYDKQTPPVLRRKIGYDPDSTLFVDEWYNPSGTLAAYIDTDGKLIVNEGVFKGNITTLLNAYVGNNLYLGEIDDHFNVKRIYFNDLANISGDSDTIGFNCISVNMGGVSNIQLNGNVDFNTSFMLGSADFSSATVTGLETSGYKNGATTGNDSHTHTVVVGGTTYTTSSNTHHHTQT